MCKQCNEYARTHRNYNYCPICGEQLKSFVFVDEDGEVIVDEEEEEQHVTSDTNYSLSGEPLKQPVNKTTYIDNIITIYDINGKVIKQYRGRYAILEHTDAKIVFESENKHKHTIHISNGVVTIDQK